MKANIWLFLVLLLGLAIRIFALQHTYIVNPDGAVYIHQARTIYFSADKMGEIVALGSRFIYPMLIAGAYGVVGDWVTAGRLVSLFFGMVTLIPVYLLLRRIAEEKISLLATLTVALVPVFVGRSVDIVREPIFWFFSATGLWLFSCQIGKKQCAIALFLSTISFVMATAVRTEGIAFLAVSFLFILAFETGKLKKLFIFSGLMIFVLFAVGVIKGDVWGYSVGFVNSFWNAASGSFRRYEILRSDLVHLISQQGGTLRYFLPEVKTSIWLVALGTLLNRCLEGLFYPFFAVMLVGILNCWKKIWTDRQYLYFSLVLIIFVLLLYLHTIRYWMLYYRFVFVLMFPCLFLLAEGLEKIYNVLCRWFTLKKSIALVVVSILIIIVGLPKNLKARGKDKVVFKKIGEFVRKNEMGGESVIYIASSHHTHRWISFYANLTCESAPSPEPDYGFRWDTFAKNESSFNSSLYRRGVKYVLWEEKHWEASEEVLRINSALIELGHWGHPDTGKMILFKVDSKIIEHYGK